MASRATGYIDITDGGGIFYASIDSSSAGLRETLEDGIARESWEDEDEAIDAAMEEAKLLVSSGDAASITVMYEGSTRAIIKKDRKSRK